MQIHNIYIYIHIYWLIYFQWTYAGYFSRKIWRVRVPYTGSRLANICKSIYCSQRNWLEMIYRENYGTTPGYQHKWRHMTYRTKQTNQSQLIGSMSGVYMYIPTFGWILWSNVAINIRYISRFLKSHPSPLDLRISNPARCICLWIVDTSGASPVARGRLLGFCACEAGKSWCMYINMWCNVMLVE